MWVLLSFHNSEEPIMQAITTIGLDIAKSVFQVHGIDAEGKVLIRRQLKRRYVLAFFQKLSLCLVGRGLCHRREVKRLVGAGESVQSPGGAEGIGGRPHFRF